jgi:hypothetical protein
MNLKEILAAIKRFPRIYWLVIIYIAIIEGLFYSIMHNIAEII